MHKSFICKAGCLFQTWHTFYNIHLNPAIFFQILKLILVDVFLRNYLQFYLHVFWVWQEVGIKEIFYIGCCEFFTFVETTLLRRSLTVAREATTDEASPQKSNLSPPTVMRTRYFSSFRGLMSTPARSHHTQNSPMVA